MERMHPARCGDKASERGRHHPKNPMQAINDPLTVHDHGQAIRHLKIARLLCERCPNTGQRLGSAKLRGNAQRLMDIHALGSRHPILAAQIGGAR